VDSDPNLACAVVAGAGTGKTHTIVEKICAMSRKGIPVQQV
jgi:superfamily I DNA/RNA helicase